MTAEQAVTSLALKLATVEQSKSAANEEIAQTAGAHPLVCCWQVVG